MKLKVLFMSSNPSLDYEYDQETGEIVGLESVSVLQLDEEYRSIEQAIARNSDKGAVELKIKTAPRMTDLIEALNQEKPDILHFSGHGMEKSGELCLVKDIDTTPTAIPTEALSTLFETVEDNLKVVFLDSCYSKVQAEAIITHVDYVIAMNDAIGDDSATTLATMFYSAFASGKSLQNAFKQAKIMLMANHPDEKNIPELLMRTEDVKDFSLADFLQTPQDNGEARGDEKPAGKSEDGGTTINIGRDVNGQIITGGHNTVSK